MEPGSRTKTKTNRLTPQDGLKIVGLGLVIAPIHAHFAHIHENHLPKPPRNLKSSLSAILEQLIQVEAAQSHTRKQTLLYVIPGDACEL